MKWESVTINTVMNEWLISWERTVVTMEGTRPNAGMPMATMIENQKDLVAAVEQPRAESKAKEDSDRKAGCGHGKPGQTEAELLRKESTDIKSQMNQIKLENNRLN